MLLQYKHIKWKIDVFKSFLNCVVVVYTKVGRQIVPQSGASAGESSTAETF